MNNIKHKRISVASLITGYLLAGMFILLMILNRHQPVEGVETVAVVEKNNTIIEEKKVYVQTPTLPRAPYVDYLEPRTIVPGTVDVYRDDINIVDDVTVYSRANDRGIYNHDTRVRVGNETLGGDRRDHINRGNRLGVDRGDVVLRDDVVEEENLLDRRLREFDHDRFSLEDDTGGLDLSKLTVAGDNDGELADIDSDFDFDSEETGNDGQLYAYGLPSQGVGAGVGCSTVGAGGGVSAGISAGVGEGTSNGSAVPTLGGIGTYMTPDDGTGGGVGGLVGGAGAGGAAGLYVGDVTSQLGSNPGAGSGAIGGDGYNYDHLPADGALHIMMHVDGSGSILNTRKQLDIMRDTLLKDALLPYYNNDAELYNRRVTIVSSSGERTLQFFREAAKEDNVLAIAFQDEAQPVYHLPNFNRKPEEHYLDDMNNLKASLNGYAGLYRGVMFQVDRGNTFAKSFKEFVNNSFKGEGYLVGNGLKRYYRDNNADNIRNKDGIVFSDEYHAKDSGDPTYYLNLILSAAARVGLDLRETDGGLTDGKHVAR